MFKKILEFFKKEDLIEKQPTKNRTKKSSSSTIQPSRIGELGEYKINIQLDQLPKDCKTLSDIMIQNNKSRTGYSQIDHIIISPYGIFVIETKNYQGEIKGTRKDRYWFVNKRFRMYNPLMQNYGHIKALEPVLSSIGKLKYISMISFTARCRFSIDPELRKIESDELIVYDIELSEFITRKILRIKALQTEPFLSEQQVSMIYKSVQEANITDPTARAEHVKLQQKT